MSLAKDLAVVPPKAVRCITCAALDSLESKDRQALKQAIDNPMFSIRVIIEVCAKNGVTVTKHGIYKHRHGDCARA